MIYLLFFLYCSQKIYSQVIYVSSSSACTTFCDGTYEKPFPDIAKALSSNNLSFITLLLLNGKYTGVNNVGLTIQNRNVLFKAFSNIVDIDCQNLSSAFSLSQGEFEIDGISFSNCEKKIKTGSPQEKNSGGAFSITTGRLILRNTTIQNCSSENGGALACFDSNCTIESCNFSYNIGKQYGGALYISNSKLVLLMDNHIEKNQCDKSNGGGGLYLLNSEVDPSLAGNSVINNNFISQKNKLSQFSAKATNIILESKLEVGLGVFCTGGSIIIQNCYPEPCSPKCLCQSQYFSQLNNICQNCPSIITDCLGDLSCEYICFQQSVCLCMPGYFCDGSVCSPCDPSCLTCNGTLPTECTSCIQGSFLKQDFSCGLCYETCNACNGTLPNQCVSCKQGFIYKQGYCVVNCDWDEYLAMTNECLLCNSLCKTCFNGNINGCLSCYYGKTLINGTCVEITNVSNITNNTNNNNNSANNSIDSTGKNNNNSSKTIIYSNITKLNDTEYLITFSSYLKGFHDHLINYTKIYSDDFQKQLNFSMILSNETSYLIKLEEAIKCGTSLYQNFSLNISFKFDQNEFPDYDLIPAFFIFNITVDQNLFEECQKMLSKVDFKLSYTDQANIIRLQFLEEYPILKSLENMNKSKVFIEGFIIGVDFNVTFSKVSLTEYLITLNYYHNSLSTRKMMVVQPPGINLSRSIQLYSFYQFDSEKQKEIKNIQEQQTGLSTASKAILFGSIVGRTGSSLGGAQSLMVIELIFMLKFIDINYPPNLINFFYKGSHPIHFFWKFHFTTDQQDENILPPIFDFYSITPYYLDYAGEHIARILFFYVLGFFCLLIMNLKKTRDTKFLDNKVPMKNLFEKILIFLKHTLVWEMVILVFVLNYQEILFFSMIPMKFLTLSRPFGLLNLLMAIFFFGLEIFFLSFLFNIRKKIHLFKMNKRKSIGLPFTPILNTIGKSKKRNTTIATLGLSSEIFRSPKMKSNSIYDSSNIFVMNEPKDKLEAYGEKKPSDKLNPNENLVQAKHENPELFSNKKLEKIGKLHKKHVSLSNISSLKTLDSQIQPKYKKSLNVDINKDFKFSPSHHKNDLEIQELETPFYLLQKRFREKKNLEQTDQINEIPNSIDNDNAIITALEIKIDKDKKSEEKIIGDKSGNGSHSKDSLFFNDNFLANEGKPGKIIARTTTIENNCDSPSKSPLKSPQVEINEKEFLFQDNLELQKDQPKTPNNKLSENQTKIKSDDERKKKLLDERYGFLKEEFRTNSCLQRNFLFIDLLRQTAILLIILIFFPSILIQIIGTCIVQLIFLYSSFLIKPFKTKFAKINFAFTEIFLSVSFLSCLILAIYDELDNEDIESKIKIGDVIPYCNLGLLYWVFVSILWKICEKLYHYCNEIRKHKKIHNYQEK